MLIEPNPTPYDLRFRLFGTGVRVSPWFWVLPLLFGQDFFQIGGFTWLLTVVACIFVSILLHEFGHVWMGQYFGSDGNIVLYAFGGLAIGARDQRKRWQRIAVSLAGPGIQLVFWAILTYGIMPSLNVRALPGEVQVALIVLQSINLYWPLLNLVPVFPLDGGQVSLELFEHFDRRDGRRWAFMTSMVFAAVMALNSLAVRSGAVLIPWLPAGGLFMTILFAQLAVESYLLMQASRSSWSDDRLPWE